MIKLIEDEDLRKEFGTEAYEEAKKHDLNDCINQFESYFLSLIPEKKQIKKKKPIHQHITKGIKKVYSSLVSRLL